MNVKPGFMTHSDRTAATVLVKEQFRLEAKKLRFLFCFVIKVFSTKSYFQAVAASPLYNLGIAELIYTHDYKPATLCFSPERFFVFNASSHEQQKDHQSNPSGSFSVFSHIKSSITVLSFWLTWLFGRFDPLLTSRLRGPPRVSSRICLVWPLVKAHTNNAHTCLE